MLRPLERNHLLAALRPPTDYDLDRALGTTYSLDLMTLLTVPLAFALFDWEDADGKPTTDPLAILEAMRRYADRVHIFCQAGAIAVPKGNKILLSNIENIVHEVTAPQGGVFHPKVWVLRFLPKDASLPVMYRVLCLSRNLTYDRSWDTILTLEGELTDRKNAYAANHPLADFVAALPGLMIRQAPTALKQHVDVMSEELRRVAFAPPTGFSEMRFHPIGISGYMNFSLEGDIRRLLVVSPFLSKDCLANITRDIRSCLLVSRLDELGKLTKSDLRGFQEVYSLDPDADVEDSEDADIEEGARDTPLQGLHAKLFVADCGWDARVWTGSANATTAAFQRNVEFLVEMNGKRSFCGVETIMAQVDGETRFRALLREYQPIAVPSPIDAAKQAAEDRVEAARTALAVSSFTAMVSPSPVTGSFSLKLTATKAPILAGDVDVKVWPVTLQETAGLSPNRQQAFAVSFESISFEAITTFFAFEVRTKVGTYTAVKRFAVNVPVTGMPEDRRERLLKSLLTNRGEIIRFLLFLLADEAPDALAALTGIGRKANAETSEGNSWINPDLSLLEPLLRTLHRHPDKLDRVQKLVVDLRKTPEGIGLLPPGFIAAWDPIWKVRQELQS